MGKPDANLKEGASRELLDAATGTEQKHHQLFIINLCILLFSFVVITITIRNSRCKLPCKESVERILL